MTLTAVFARELTDFLRGRDVALNPPASEQDISLLEKAIGGTLSASVRILYEAFDGFADLDWEPATLWRIWPIGEVVAGIETARLPYVDFADELHWGIIYAMDATDCSRPIRYEAVDGYPSLPAFLDDMMSRRYDQNYKARS